MRPWPHGSTHSDVPDTCSFKLLKPAANSNHQIKDPLSGLILTTRLFLSSKVDLVGYQELLVLHLPRTAKFVRTAKAIITPE